jgi:AraC-like DNA-binding protein
MQVIITTADTTTAATFLADLAAGTAQLHKERANGTTRRLHFLAPGSEARELADFIDAQRDNGLTMAAIAASLHMSPAAARRAYNDLLLTREYEELEAEEIEALLLGAEDLNEAPVDTQADKACDWVGHDMAINEHGICPVCQ